VESFDFRYARLKEQSLEWMMVRLELVFFLVHGGGSYFHLMLSAVNKHLNRYDFLGCFFGDTSMHAPLDHAYCSSLIVNLELMNQSSVSLRRPI